MAKSIDVLYDGMPCYPIKLEQSFQPLISAINEAGFLRNRKVCIVSDSNVAELYLNELRELFETCFSGVITFVFSAGEASKKLNTVQKLYEELIKYKFDRQDLLVALGGGVTGDLTGFTAATYLRGIDFIQIPTTLLAQVDSSIGGKTGVDFAMYKNMVGAFYQPRLVYMNLSVLNTLPKEQFICGMGEILKHGLIKDRVYFQWLKQNYEKIMEMEETAIEEMVYKSCQIKQGVVERDPKEQGERALLNFGHTIGHAVEKLSDFKLYHGQCVSVGMAGAAKLSCSLGNISSMEYEEIMETLERFGLPTKVSGLKAFDILQTTKSDKKMISGKIKFILLHSIGNSYIEDSLTDEQLLEGISSILDTGGQKQQLQDGRK